MDTFCPGLIRCQILSRLITSSNTRYPFFLHATGDEEGNLHVVRGSRNHGRQCSNASPCTSELTLREWTEGLGQCIHAPVVVHEEGEEVGGRDDGGSHHCYSSRLVRVPTMMQPLCSTLGLCFVYLYYRFVKRAGAWSDARRNIPILDVV